MACPAPTVESAPSWLDRLRTSKGFPPHHAGLDLDHFLLLPDPDPDPDTNTDPSPPPPSNAPLAAENPLHPPQPRQREEVGGAAGGDGKTWFDIMSSALAELFHMEDPRELRAALKKKKKNARKQPNPRICVVSAPASNAGSCPAGEQGACVGGGLQALSPPSAENSTAGAKKWLQGRTKAKRSRAACSRAVDSSDLSAYSRTEVTVIDTSSPSWKSQMIIFRKGLVWKVRDKKAWNLCRKKRKLATVKRLASENEQEELTLAGKREVLGKDHLASSNEGFISKDISGNPNQIPEKRVQFPRSSRKAIAKDSSLSCL